MTTSSININVPAANAPISSSAVRTNFRAAASDINALFALAGPITGLTGSGMLAQTSTGNYALRTIAGTANQITVVNGSGASGAPTIGLASNPIIPGTGGMLPPAGNTASRASIGSGTFRYNSDLALLEFYNGSSWNQLQTGGAGSGTVTSVGMTGDGVIYNTTVTGAPITGAGTLVPVLLTQTKNTVLIGPTTGSAATPTFRLLVGADLPNPSSSTLGGVQSAAAVSHQWINSISTSGVPSLSQPAFADISGSVTAAQLPNPGASSLGGVQSFAAVSHQFVTQISTSGVVSAAQPAFTDISGVAATTQIPAFSGDATSSSGATVLTLATVNSNIGTFNGSTVNGKGLTTAIADLQHKKWCRVATTIALSATYSNGSSGVGATLTNSATQVALTIDGVALAVNDRVLVKNQVTQFQNGIYIVTSVGSGAANWVLTRAGDFDGSTAGNVSEGALTAIAEGILNAGSIYIENGAGPFTIGTTAITWNPGAGSFPIRLGTYNYYDFLNGQSRAADEIITLQNFTLAAQLKAYALNAGSQALDDQNIRNYITNDVSRGNYQVTCPFVTPELTAANYQGTIIRVGQSGTPTATYTGDMTTQALANKEQPAVIVTPGSHVLGTLTVYANSNGSDRGSGVAIGKNWWANSATIQAAGSGYSVNDVLSGPQPSKAPYSAWGYTVSAVNGSGAITAGAITFRGGYALPPILQQQQWTAANGFTGAIANGAIGKVFDPAHAGWYVTSGGTGTGAEFTIGWVNDFAADGSIYTMGNNVIADTLIENISVQQSGSTLDGTYGPTFGTLWGGLNYNIMGQIESNSGYYGAYFYGVADVHGGIFNPVNATNGMKINQGGSILTSLIVDTPSATGLQVDGAEGIKMRGYGINIGGAINGAGFLALGSDGTISDTGHLNTGLDLDFTISNLGGAPAAYLDYTTASHVNIVVANKAQGGGTVAHPTTVFAHFGSHYDNTNVLTGQIDGVSGNIFTGTVPNAGIRVWDGALPGWALGAGMYEIAGSGAPTSGGSGTGVNKAGIGSTYVDYTNGHLYINQSAASSPTWVQVDGGGGGGGITALTGDVTASGSGSVAATVVGINGVIVYNTADSTAGASIAIGSGSLSGQTSSAAYSSTAVGYQALHGTMTTAAVRNTAIGFQAGSKVTSGHNNTYLGAYAGANGTTTQQYNVFIGDQAGYSNTGNYCTGIGGLAVYQATGDYNFGIGYLAGQKIGSGTNNLAIGTLSMGNGASNITGSYNCGLGTQALYNLAGAAAQNTAIGGLAGVNATSASYNVLIGYLAGGSITTASSNVIIGYTVGSTTLTTGSNNILIGNFSSIDVATGSTSNTINIGGVFTSTSINTTPASQLSGSLGMTGLITKYNNIATVAGGHPAIYGTGRATGQTAANASVATYTVGAADGSFVVSANVLVTTATTHAFTVTVSYTSEDNTSRVLTLQFSNLAGTFITSIANAAGAVPYEGVPLHIRCKAATAITIASAAGGVYTSVVYNIEGYISQIG